MAETLMDCFGDTIKAYLHSQAAEHHDHSVLEDTSGGLRDLFLHHLLQLRCNSHRVTAVLETGGLAERGEMVQTSHKVTLGSAVFPTASLFNHSCWPNIIFRSTTMQTLTNLSHVSSNVRLYHCTTGFKGIMLRLWPPD